MNFSSEESSTVSSANDNQNKEIETDDEIDECDEDDEEINSSATSCSRKFIRRNINWDELKLPDTCTMLTTSQGAKVFIIGTAHFSRYVKSLAILLRIVFIIRLQYRHRYAKSTAATILKTYP